MAIFLYHKYALPALKSEILKGVDRLIYDALMEKGMAATLYGLVFSVETNREGVFQEIQAKETPVEYLFYGLSVSPENVDDRIERVHAPCGRLQMPRQPETTLRQTLSRMDGE